MAKHFALLLILLLAIVPTTAYVLSAPRSEMGSASLLFANKSVVIFAGGRFEGVPLSVVDYFYFVESVGRTPVLQRDAFLNKPLHEARYDLVGATAGTVVAFAGGMNSSGPSAAVEVYDVALSSSGEWVTHYLSAPSASLFGAGASRSIAFGQASEDNSTLLDVLDVNTMQWHRFDLPDRCYRAAAKNTTITVLCDLGIRIYNESLFEWTLVPFGKPFDSLNNVTVGSDWMKAENKTMTYAGIGLLSTPFLGSSYTIANYVASATAITFFGGGPNCLPYSISIVHYTGSSAASATWIAGYWRTRIDNIRRGFAVAYASTDKLVVAGGYYPGWNDFCNVHRYGSVNIDVLRNRIGGDVSSACRGYPPYTDIYCAESMTWVRDEPLEVSNSTMEVSYRLALNGSLTIGRGAALSIASGGRLLVNAPVVLETDSMVLIKRGGSYYDTGAYSLRTTWTVDFGDNVTVRLIADPGVQGNDGTMWNALSSPFLLKSSANFRLEGVWPNDPGDTSVALVQAGGWSNFVNRSLMNFTIDTKWSDPRKTVSRYSCATNLYIYIFSNGSVRTWYGSSETEDNCGLYRDMLLIMIIAIVFAAAAVWALWLHFRQPSFTTPAPPLEKEETCSVCLQPCENPVLVRCKHRFCEACIQQWAALRNTCPICRGTLQLVNARNFGKRMYYSALGSYFFLGLTALTWLDLNHATENSIFSYAMWVLLMFISCLFWLVFVDVLRRASIELDEARPHSSGTRWFAIQWHIVVPIFAFATFMLSYGAYAYQYTEFFNVDSLYCSDSTYSPCWNSRWYNGVGWKGFLMDHRRIAWSEAEEFLKSEDLGIKMDNRAAALAIIGVCIVLIIIVSLLVLLITIAHYVLVVLLPERRYTRPLARLALPAVTVLGIVGIIASFTVAIIVAIYTGEDNYDSDHSLPWIHSGHACIDMAVIAFLVQTSFCIFVHYRFNARSLRNNNAPEVEQEMRILNNAAALDDDVEVGDLPLPRHEPPRAEGGPQQQRQAAPPSAADAPQAAPTIERSASPVSIPAAVAPSEAPVPLPAVGVIHWSSARSEESDP